MSQELHVTRRDHGSSSNCDPTVRCRQGWCVDCGDCKVHDCKCAGEGTPRKKQRGERGKDRAGPEGGSRQPTAVVSSVHLGGEHRPE